MDIDKLTFGEIKQLASILGLNVAHEKRLVPPIGRAVVVVDRGWIYAGDMSLTDDNYLRLNNAVHVFNWREIGFMQVLTEWNTSSKIDIRCCPFPVEIPHHAIVYRIRVDSTWGLTSSPP